MSDRDIAILPAQATAGQGKRDIHSLWVQIRRELHSDAAKTALGAWLALRIYCTLLGIVVYAIAPASFFSSAIQQVFDQHIPSCPTYFSTATGLNGALAGVWLRWDTAWYLDMATPAMAALPSCRSTPR